MSTQIQGTIVDVVHRRMYGGRVVVDGTHIAAVEADNSVTGGPYILPGFVDAHVHIESSLLIPSEFVRLAVLHGTVATVSDPHEIANVCGMAGIEFMINNAAGLPFTIAFGAPSCVPATIFETAGAEITADDIRTLLARPDIRYLSEMMNWPGVLNADPGVMEKIGIAQNYGKPVDGHAPGLTGERARAYAGCGIATDHECFTLQEALDKVACGMKILIREGSAARNFDALHPLIGQHPDNVMFCCDDAHPDLLINGHINNHVRRALALQYDLFDVLRAASYNPVQHYQLPVGLLQENDSADFIIVDDLASMKVLQTWIRGTCVADRGTCLIPSTTATPINNFTATPITAADIQVDATGTVRVIVAHDGLLTTTEEHLSPSDPDVLKLCVVNRYTKAPVAIAWVRGFGLQHGAMASSVAHDSHNIVAVGRTDTAIVQAVNAVIREKGGLSVYDDHSASVLPLPVAGLMSTADARSVAEQYAALDAAAKKLGSELRAPFMTLSFMALLVIPKLKLSDKGLFDGESFSFVSVSIS